MKNSIFSLLILVPCAFLISCEGGSQSQTSVSEELNIQNANTNESSQTSNSNENPAKDNRANENSNSINESNNGLIDPIQYFNSKPKSVMEKSYHANASMKEAKDYFKSLNLIRYSAEAFNAETVRYRNDTKDVFIMVFPDGSNRVYIVMSREEYVDEVDV